MSDSIKAKIAALLAKAEGTDNEHEAEAFMSKATELLLKHQIEMHEIRGMANRDPMGEVEGGVKMYASMAWGTKVATALANLYDCRLIYWKVGNHIYYKVIGRESARTTTELMLPFVISQVKQAGARVARETEKSNSAMTRSVALYLTNRIYGMVKAAERSRSEAVGKGLVPVSDVDAFFKQMHPNIKIAKPAKHSSDVDAYKAAEKINLDLQMEKPHAARKIASR